MRNYGISQDYDFSASSYIYKEIKNVNLFKLEDISYNLYYNHDFTNSYFKILYRILDNVEDGVLVSDKNFKFLRFGEIIKFVYHIKRRLLNPLVSEIFSPVTMSQE